MNLTARVTNSCGRMLARLRLHLGEKLVGSQRLLPKPKKSLTKGPSVLGCQGVVLDSQAPWIWDKYPDCTCQPSWICSCSGIWRLKNMYLFQQQVFHSGESSQQEWGILEQSPVLGALLPRGPWLTQPAELARSHLLSALPWLPRV